MSATGMTLKPSTVAPEVPAEADKAMPHNLAWVGPEERSEVPAEESHEREATVSALASSSALEAGFAKRIAGSSGIGLQGIMEAGRNYCTEDSVGAMFAEPSKPARPPARSLQRRSSLSVINTSSKHSVAGNSPEIKRTMSPDGRVKPTPSAEVSIIRNLSAEGRIRRSPSAEGKIRRSSPESNPFKRSDQEVMNGASAQSAREARRKSLPMLESSMLSRRHSAVMGQTLHEINASYEALYGARQVVKADSNADECADKQPESSSTLMNFMQRNMPNLRVNKKSDDSPEESFRQKKDDLVSVLEDKLFALQTGEDAPPSEETDEMNVSKHSRAKTRWKKGFKQIVNSNRLAKQLKRNMAVFSPPPPVSLPSALLTIARHPWIVCQQHCISTQNMNNRMHTRTHTPACPPARARAHTHARSMKSPGL